MTADGTSQQHIANRTQQPMLASQRAKLQQQQEQQSPSDRANSNAKSVFFPLGYKEAAYQWWTSVTAQVAEHNVLSFIPYIKPAAAPAASKINPDCGSASANEPDPYGPRIWHSTMVQLSGKNRALNEFSVERVGEPADNTLVMLHGYGAGLGLFYKNFEPLTRQEGWRLYALDMLGMGNSSRPNFRIQAKDQQGKIREAEDWFIDALEEWRQIRKIERFTLLGHSLGGYLAVSYALKYPGRLNKLILASPVGVPEDPYAVNAEMPEPGDSTLANEFTQDQQSIVSSPSSSSSSITPSTRPTGDNNNFMNARNKRKAVDDNKNGTGAPARRPLSKWFVWLWDANVSPFSIVRLSGPLGPRFVSGWTSRRFNHLPQAEFEALHTYAYNLFRQRGSGEYALPYILAPGAYARSPVINRIQEVGRQIIKPASAATDGNPATPEVRESGIPVVMMYGDKDWMDVAGGFAAEEKLKARMLKVLTTGTPEEKRKENGGGRVVIVQNAGHHLYIDNADDFNKLVAEEMRATKEQGLRERS